MNILPEPKSDFGDYEGTALNLFPKETVRLIQVAANVVATARQAVLVGALVVVRIDTQNIALRARASVKCSHLHSSSHEPVEP